MLVEYIRAALEMAKYELLPNEKEKIYAEIPSCRGVWATGRTIEECRKNLISTLEGWIIIRLRRNLPIPKVKNHSIKTQKVK